VKARFGGIGTDNGQFVSPSAVAYSQGKLFVLDEGTNRVQLFM
jgi:hypothetical protein